MRFAFTDEQIAFRDAVRDLLEKECPPGAVRDAWENTTGRSERAWDQLATMGVLGVLVPESSGGLGLTELDLVLLLEETGRAALPEPIVEHAMVAAPLVSDAPRTITAALGAAPFVPYADSADAVLVADDERLLLVPRDALALEPRGSVDRSRRLFAIEWPADAETEVGGPSELARAFDRGALGTAAQLIGLARHLLDTTVEYAKQRHQFGAPIGSFQAVKHHLSDVRLALEFAAPLVHRAAHSLAHRDPEADVHVSMAKAQASDTARLAARHALQCHGAIGYSYEHDLHLWMKRAWALAATWGDASWHRERVARAIL